MPLKVAIVQQAARTSTGDQSWTDSNAGFDSDVKAAIFMGGVYATSNHTPATGCRATIGLMCTGPDKYAISQIFDGSARNSVQRPADSYAASVATGGSSVEFAPHATTPFLSNGVQVTYSDAAEEAHLISCLLLGGDIEANIITVDLNAASSATGVSHGLSGAPEAIIALAIGESGGPDSALNDLGWSVGFWDGTNYICFVTESSDANNLNGRITTAGLAAVSDTSGNISTGGYLTLANVGASTLDVTSNTTQDWGVTLLCLRGTSSALEAKCGAYTTPTGTGDSAMSLSLGAAPQAVIMLPTRATATNTAYVASSTADAVSLFGALAACNNAGAGTQYGGAVAQFDENGTTFTSDATNSQALRVPDTTGAADVEATVKASTGWGASDITLNFSNVAASGYKIPYLAFGIAGLVKYLKLLVHPSAVGETVDGIVLAASATSPLDLAGAVIGEFTDATFTDGGGSPQSDPGYAVLKVPVADFGGESLTTSDTPKVHVENATYTTGLYSATVIEE